MKKERILTTAAFLLLIGASSQAGSAFASSRRGTDASTESSAASATRGMNGQQSRNETKVTGTVFDNVGEPIIGTDSAGRRKTDGDAAIGVATD